MYTKEEALKKISELVERFDEHKESYKSSSYNEDNTKVEFISPFFDALGWDVGNKSGNAEAYKEVIFEPIVKIKGRVKNPDYSFRLPGSKRPLFFVEAKKPFIDVRNDSDPAYQIRNYAWNAKLPISLVTDFEELAVYDCTKKPKIKDKANIARLKYLSYKDYLLSENFDFIWNTFSKERVLKGSFDKFIASDASKRGKETVDTDFLKSIEEWRTKLAVNIGLKNPAINEDELNFAVQMTLDRLIFLRICEDRGLEQYGNMKVRAKTGNFYRNMFEYFQQADSKYNSGLFDFKKDKLSQAISIDNNVMKEIVDSLYDGPYIFDVIPVEILGNAYEQFLGKVIRLDDKHSVVIEEKPEVRKAGGVYYTPQYIVDYIVQNTVGKLIEGKTPKQIESLKIVDPACGSGSFLLGAYSYLLDYHREYYKTNPPAKKKDAPLTQNGDLSTNEKKKILLKNIYGVDIDAQAVEVTKLSLLLKCMEGETEASIEQQQGLFHEKVLPTLDSNIKSGNSLISSDFYDSHLDFEPGVEKKIKPFDWEKAFPDVFKQGGFDAVIGNPPYGADYGNDMKHYLSTKYELAIPIADTFLMFLRRSFSIAKENSFISYIIPTTWLYMPQYLDFRKQLINSIEISEIQLFRKPVFINATVETCIFIASNKKPTSKSILHFKEIKDDPQNFISINNELKQADLIKEKEPSLYLSNKNDKTLFTKIQKNHTALENLALIVCGLTPYRLGKGKPPQTHKIVEVKAFDANYKKDDTYRQYLMGRDFHKYKWQIEKERWISYGDWLAEPRYKAPFNEEKKIVIRQTADSIIAHIDTNQFISLKNVHNLKITNSKMSYEFLLGLLNSKLINWWYQQLIPEKGRVFAEVKVVNLEKLPIATINFKNPNEKQLSDDITKLVDTMLSLNKELQETSVPDRQEQLRTRIDHTDRRIDRLVYELYGLTEDEIAIVEGR